LEQQVTEIWQLQTVTAALVGRVALPKIRSRIRLRCPLLFLRIVTKKES